MARPKGPDLAMLAKRNVTVELEHEEFENIYHLTCNVCGETWPVTYVGGRLAPLYWLCPKKGCNAVIDQAPDKPAPAAVIPTDLDALPAILTPAEAAALLRVSETTVKDWARAGELPGAFKLGKEWRVERDALMKHIRGA